jgi:hypothetical protein
MRWFSRANIPEVVFDGLLEGSLVGVVYLAIALGGPGSNARLSLVEFWLAAAAGVVLARWRPAWLSHIDAVSALALVVGVGGWLADPAARDALTASKLPWDVLATQPAGWLLGLAVLRGGAHRDVDHESETSTRAITFGLPVLAASLLLGLGSGSAFVVPAVVGSTVCVAVGLLSIGRARLQELERLGSVTHGGRTWPVLAVAVVVLAALAIPLAIVVGTSAPTAMTFDVHPAERAIGSLLAGFGNVLAWLASIPGLFLNGAHSSVPRDLPAPTAIPSTAPSIPAPRSASSSISLPSMPWLTTLLWVGLGAAVVLLVVRFRRLVTGRNVPTLAEELSAAPREERRREPFLARLNLHLSRPGIHPRLPWRHSPTSAAEAYVALLADLSDKGGLARKPAETPQSHAVRAGSMGLPRLPLGLLAADYELAVYGQTAVSRPETARAIGRWRRLRRLARRERELASRREDRGILKGIPPAGEALGAYRGPWLPDASEQPSAKTDAGHRGS